MTQILRVAKARSHPNFLIHFCAFLTSVISAACGQTHPASLPSQPSPTTSNRTCAAFTQDDDIWMGVQQPELGQFHFRIGPGGVISEFKDVTTGSESLLSPSYQGEATDRTIQQVVWINSITVPSAPTPDKRFASNQAGNHANQFTSTSSVELNSAACQIDIYAIGGETWFPEMQGNATARIGIFTRYQIGSLGEIQVRRVLSFDSMSVNQAAVSGQLSTGDLKSLSNVYLEQWNPFLSPYFNALGLDFDESMKPHTWFSFANIPYYPNYRARYFSGYAVGYRQGSEHSQPAVGVVYGSQDPQCNNADPSTCGTRLVLNSMTWNNGLGILPAIEVDQMPMKSFVDHTYYLVPTHEGLSSSFLSNLKDLNQAIPRSRLIAPNSEISDDLTVIIQKLSETLKNNSGQRLEHLAQLAKGV